jgi:hypothetical protein
MAINGARRKIPEKYWPEIYLLYSEGMRVEDLTSKINNEWHIQCAPSSVWSLLKELRSRRQELLDEFMGSHAEDTFLRYKHFQQEVEEMAFANKHNPELFLKIVDRLQKMYEFQLNFKQVTVNHTANQLFTDSGRQELLAELRAN